MERYLVDPLSSDAVSSSAACMCLIAPQFTRWGRSELKLHSIRVNQVALRPLPPCVGVWLRWCVAHRTR